MSKLKVVILSVKKIFTQFLIAKKKLDLIMN